MKKEVRKAEKRIEEVEEDKRSMLAEIENLKQFRGEEDREREELREEIKRLREVEEKVKEQEIHEKRLIEEVKSLQEKVNDKEKNLQEKNVQINDLENSGEVLAGLVEAKSAFDNSMDGVANRKDEVRKSSVEEMDPLDSASQEGDRNTESDDELIAGIVDGMLEIGNEGNVKRGAKSPAEEQQVVKQ